MCSHLNQQHKLQHYTWKLNHDQAIWDFKMKCYCEHLKEHIGYLVKILKT